MTFGALRRHHPVGCDDQPGVGGVTHERTERPGFVWELVPALVQVFPYVIGREIRAGFGEEPYRGFGVLFPCRVGVFLDRFECGVAGFDAF